MRFTVNPFRPDDELLPVDLGRDSLIVSILIRIFDTVPQVGDTWAHNLKRLKRKIG
jgi:hypothetical protein